MTRPMIRLFVAMSAALASGSAAAQEMPAPPGPGVALPSETARLEALVARHREAQGLRPLTRSATLDQVAAMTAGHLSGSGATATPNHAEVYSDLVKRMYIPMVDLELAAHAGADPAQALSVWLGDPRTAAALADGTVEEVGIAMEPNTAATGPHEAYTWVLLMAKPLRASPEAADSPRFGRTVP